jgi:lipopolysaccharide biosynthesis glycosyltransferase
MNEEKKRLAFLISTSGLSFAAGNVALGINKYMPIDMEYDILVYYNSVNDKDITVLQNIPHVHPHQFYFPVDFVEEMKNRIDNERFNIMTFCHFEIFNLLEKYKKVIWLDNDMSIQRDISELLNFHGFTITDDAEWPVKAQFSKIIEGYNMDKQAVCAAFIVVDDSLPFKELYKWCYSKALEYAEYLVTHDQAIINLALQEFEINANIIPSNIWQCTTFRPLVHQANIAHFGYNWKPWMHSELIKRFPEWYRIHLEWLKLGGTDFPKHDDMDLLNRLTPEYLHEYKKKIIKRVKIFGIPIFIIEKSITEKEKKMSIHLFNRILIYKKTRNLLS